MCTDIYTYHAPLPHFSLLSIICTDCQHIDDTIWMICCFFMTVASQCFLALFLPNDTARARDIWMSYIASLISAYAKLSFFPPPFSLSLSQPEIYALWPTLLTSTFCDSLKQLLTDSAVPLCTLSVYNCLFTGKKPPPQSRTPPCRSNLTLMLKMKYTNCCWVFFFR